MEARLIQFAYQHGVHAVTLDAETFDGPLRRCGASLDLLRFSVMLHLLDARG
jgi:hypothetical protein